MIDFKSQKIIIVTPWFGNFSGGAEYLAKSMATELNKRGIEAIIFTTCCKSPNNDWWTDYYPEGKTVIENILVYRFPTNKKSKLKHKLVVKKLINNDPLTEQEKTSFFIDGINSDKLVSSLKSFISDGYNVISLPFFQGLTHSVVNAYPGKISLIPCFHEEPQFYWNDVKKLLLNAKNIFFNSIEEKDMTIKNYGIDAGKKIIEGVVTGVGLEINQEKIKSNEFDIKQDYFIYVGRKDNGKNISLLCQWFVTYIKKYNKKAKIIFAGSGDHSLIPSNNQNFIDLGFVSESQKYELIQNAKALINLSYNESFSIVIMEAWLLKVPTIVYQKCDVTTGHSIRSNAGLYVENETEFCLSLKYIEDNPETARMMGLNGSDYVREEFSFDHVLSKYLLGLKKYENTY